MRYPIFQGLWAIGLFCLFATAHGQSAQSQPEQTREAAKTTLGHAVAALGNVSAIPLAVQPLATDPLATDSPAAQSPAAQSLAAQPLAAHAGVPQLATAQPGANHGPALQPPFGQPPAAQPGAQPVATVPTLPTFQPLLAPAIDRAKARPVTAFRMLPLSLEAGTGRVVTLDAPAASVFAADPRVAEVRPASPTTLFILGVGPGHTTIAAIDGEGAPVAQYDVLVQPSNYAAAQAQGAIARLLPGRAIRVSSRPSGLVVEGALQTPAEAEQALQVARDFAPAGQNVESRLSISTSVQVNLRVRIAEVSRNVVRQLGINWTGLAELGHYAAIGIATANPLANTSLPASILGGGYNFNTPGHRVDINALIDAMAQDQLVHVLAEPNLTATSGETASFLVGGEFPIPIAQQNNEVTIEFKQYGVSLAFVPTVLSAGRINMKVRPEVSQLTNVGAVSLGVGNSAIQVPALTVRRAETTVELASGQSFAIAGLLQDATSHTGNALPGIGEVPILGALFRSDSFQRNETELVIVITPYIVSGVASPAQAKLPTDGLRPPTDLERVLLLRQTARGGDANRPSPHIPGDAGFVVQ